MSIIVVASFKEGVVLGSSIMTASPSDNLEFHNTIAQAIGENFKAVVANDPIVQSIKCPHVVDGRAEQIALMLGMQEEFSADFQVYPLGDVEGYGEVDLWVDRSVEGEMRIAYCSAGSRDANGEEVLISSLRFPSEDLDELLAILVADRSNETSVEDIEDEE